MKNFIVFKGKSIIRKSVHKISNLNVTNRIGREFDLEDYNGTIVATNLSSLGVFILDTNSFTDVKLPIIKDIIKHIFGLKPY